jgi:PleD family two-component response regulator
MPQPSDEMAVQKILIVDDSKTESLVLTELLVGAGLVVLAAMVPNVWTGILAGAGVVMVIVESIMYNRIFRPFARPVESDCDCADCNCEECQ